MKFLLFLILLAVLGLFWPFVWIVISLIAVIYIWSIFMKHREYIAKLPTLLLKAVPVFLGQLRSGSHDVQWFLIFFAIVLIIGLLS